MGGSAADILFLGLLIIGGLGAGLVASRYGLPRIAAYVLVGVLFSERLLGGALGLAVGEWTEPLTSTTLGMIAYLIGGSITVPQIRRMGKVIIGSAFGEAVGAAVFVFVVVLLLGPRIADIPPVQTALALGAIAASTAPAATIAVLHEYRARGPLTTTLLGVVAIDDAIGVILFSLMLVASVGESLTTTLGSALLSLAGALVLGLVAGKGLALGGRRVRRAALRLPLVLGAILLVLGLAELGGLSSLLAAMATGFFARFFSGATADRLFAPIEFLEEAIFVVFFTVAGAHFDPSVFSDHGVLIAAYFVARIVGKILGAWIGARLSGAPEVVVRWLGIGLVPQAGVTIGLALALSQVPAFSAGGQTIVNVILGTTVLYEIIGPLATRMALQRAGELRTKREMKRNRA